MVRRRLLQTGLVARMTFRRLPLSRNHKRLRMQWACKRRRWRAEWQHVVGQSLASTCRTEIAAYRGVCNLTACIVERRSGRTLIVTVWGVIEYNMRSRLLRTEGNLNSNGYTREVLEPEVLALLHVTAQFIFQQENTRSHVARDVQTSFNERRAPLLPWPARSPDMSPIEHRCHPGHQMFTSVDRRLREKGTFTPNRYFTCMTCKVRTARFEEEVLEHIADSPSSSTRFCTHDSHTRSAVKRSEPYIQLISSHVSILLAGFCITKQTNLGFFAIFCGQTRLLPRTRHVVRNSHVWNDMQWLNTSMLLAFGPSWSATTSLDQCTSCRHVWPPLSRVFRGHTTSSVGGCVFTLMPMHTSVWKPVPTLTYIWRALDRQRRTSEVSTTLPRPDATYLFLWDHLRSLVYETPVNTTTDPCTIILNTPTRLCLHQTVECATLSFVPGFATFNSYCKTRTRNICKARSRAVTFYVIPLLITTTGEHVLGYPNMHIMLNAVLQCGVGRLNAVLQCGVGRLNAVLQCGVGRLNAVLQCGVGRLNAVLQCGVGRLNAVLQCGVGRLNAVLQCGVRRLNRSNNTPAYLYHIANNEKKDGSLHAILASGVFSTPLMTHVRKELWCPFFPTSNSIFSEEELFGVRSYILVTLKTPMIQEHAAEFCDDPLLEKIQLSAFSFLATPTVDGEVKNTATFTTAQTQLTRDVKTRRVHIGRIWEAHFSRAEQWRPYWFYRHRVHQIDTRDLGSEMEPTISHLGSVSHFPPCRMPVTVTLNFDLDPILPILWVGGGRSANTSVYRPVEKVWVNPANQQQGGSFHLATSTPQASLCTIHGHMAAGETSVHRYRVQVAITERCLSPWPPVRRLPLRSEHHRACVTFYRELAVRQLVDWRRVVFSDESRFCLDTEAHRFQVRTRPVQHRDQPFIVE
ncbi:hypothetical protein PR048_011155 [Dryococelus australis]|uniref:Transposase Tc1-like domain-containing protein n=1 Tax=Dryococelus australis TaxID=614101 RepID=A0ABQ9HKS8_9NEOP|nr:hypothetical protein PR048_011155 [Dryococelus australis]